MSQEIITALLCLHKEQISCGKCRSCVMIEHGTHPDRLSIQADEGSLIKIDQLREVIQKVENSPKVSKHHVVYIERCETMTTQCANALLKTLEEPKKNMFIVLQCNEKSKILPTILSRCFIETPQINRNQLQQFFEKIEQLYPHYKFLKYTHFEQPLLIDDFVKDKRTHELYKTVAQSLWQRNWQPVHVSESLKSYQAHDIIDCYTNCLTSILAKKSNISERETKLFDVIQDEFELDDSPKLSSWQGFRILSTLMDAKSTLSSAVVATGSYLLERTLIDIWNIQRSPGN